MTHKEIIALIFKEYLQIKRKDKPNRKLSKREKNDLEYKKMLNFSYN